MARDLFIAPKIGTGTREDPFRPKVSGNITGFVAACNDTQCLVLVTGDTSANKNDSQLLTLINENLYVAPSSLTNAERTRIQNGLNTKGIPLTFTSYPTVKDFLQALGEFFDPNFDFDLFWVAG